MKITPNAVLFITVVLFIASLFGYAAIGECGDVFNGETYAKVKMSVMAMPYVWLFVAMLFDIEEKDKKK